MVIAVPLRFKSAREIYMAMNPDSERHILAGLVIAFVEEGAHKSERYFCNSDLTIDEDLFVPIGYNVKVTFEYELKTISTKTKGLGLESEMAPWLKNATAKIGDIEE